jgi:hypothetical protein
VIHYVGTDLQAQLAAHLCPITVHDGPELRPPTTPARERVIIEHDMSGSDAYLSTHTPGNKPPRTRLTRNVACKITLYAKDPRPGSMYWEHVQRAERILDLVLIGLDIVAKQRANIVQFKSGKFIFPKDLSSSETPGGATYELLFNFDRGVTDRNWDGSTDGTFTILEDTIQNTTYANGELAAGTGDT